MDPNLLFNCLDNGWIMGVGSIGLNIKFSKKFKMFNSSHLWVHQEEDVTKFQEEYRLNS